MLRSSVQPSFAAGVVVVAALLAGAPATRAGYTPVHSPKRQNQLNHEQILERTYGGDFISDATGLSFSNDSGVTVTRMEDFGGTRTDATWDGRIVSARAVAASSRHQKTASYFGTRSGGSVQRLVEAAPGSRAEFSEAGQVRALASSDLWMGSGKRSGKMFSSVTDSNRDSRDHLVSYEVKGLSGQQASVYLLCWEGKFAKNTAPDFNDLVIEMQAGQVAEANSVTEPLLIPLPPALWSGLSGLAGLAGAYAYRRVRRVL